MDDLWEESGRGHPGDEHAGDGSGSCLNSALAHLTSGMRQLSHGRGRDWSDLFHALRWLPSPPRSLTKEKNQAVSGRHVFIVICGHFSKTNCVSPATHHYYWTARPLRQESNRLAILVSATGASC